MKFFYDLIEKLSIKTIEVLALLLFACITLMGAFRSVYLEHGYGLKLLNVSDSPIVNVIFIIVTFVVLKVVADFVAQDVDKRTNILLIVTLIYAFCLSLGWAAVSKCFPTADQASVYYGAKHFAVDYFADIAEKNSYFSCYPHQMGLTFFYEVLFRIFHMDSYHLLQAVNALCNSVTILALYKITEHIFENKKICVYFLLLMIICFPLYWYAPFVYGELPSFALGFVGFWMLLRGISKDKSICLVASMLAFTCATAVRKNTLIFIIAVVLTMLVYFLKKQKCKYLLYVILLVLLCTQVNNVIILRYEKCAGVKLNDGVPSISHVVMGVQESEYSPAPGWYNGFNFNTYAYEADYNQEKAITISKNALKLRLEELKDNPSYTWNFFGQKFMAEWLNSGYDCIYYTSGKYYERFPIVESLYSGAGFYIACFFMDKYQLVIYLFALVFIVSGLAHKKTKTEKITKDTDNIIIDHCGIFKYTLLLTIIGGAIFYLVWEGGGRYILPYFIMTIPYAAAGIETVDKFVFSLKRCKPDV